MYIENLRIEHFGQLNDVCADGLHRQLSVLWCSRDSERDDARDFLRWLLFGVTAVSCPETGVDGDFEARARGSVSVCQDGRRQQIRRLDDGTRYGRLSIDGLRDESTADVRSQLGRVTPLEFDVVFAPRLDLDPHPDQLLDAVHSVILDVSPRRVSSERCRELAARLDQLRSERDRMPQSDSVGHLIQRRGELTRRMEQMTQRPQRRQDLRNEYRDLSQRIEQLGQEISHRRHEYQARDDEVKRHRHELESVWRKAQQAKESFLRQRREELAELDTRSNRWQGILHEVQRRLANVDDQLRHSPGAIGRPAEPSCLVANLAAQLDRLRQDVADRIEHPKYSNGSLGETAAYQTITGSETLAALDDLCREVSRLCRTLQDHQRFDKQRWLSSEVDYLRQCETVMTCWLGKLQEQRDQLQRELNDAESTGVALVDVGERLERGHYAANYVDWDGQYARDPYGGQPFGEAGDDESAVRRPASPRGFTHAVAHSCDGYDVAHPDADSLLKELIRRRDAVSRELEARQRTVDSLMAEQRVREGCNARCNDRERYGIRRELAEIQVSLRTAEQRERLTREIAHVQDELRYEKEQVQPSPVTIEASRILRRLTQGRFNRVHIDDVRRVTVDDARCSVVNLREATRELRGDVYLAMCLALVAVYHREGMKLPLVMVDPFLLTNAGHAATRAAVIRDFANEGHQVLLLTSRRRVADLFHSSDATFVELQPGRDVRPLPQPSPEPLPERRITETEHDSEFEDHVRFKQRSRSARRDIEPVGDATRPISSMSATPSEKKSAKPSGELVSQHIEPANTRVKNGKTTPVAATTEEEKHSLAPRFLLNSSDRLVDAPSIGPRTAAHFQRIGVRSIAEFLRLNPEDAAARIDNRRIKPNTILQWQQQAALACRIPGIRARDAQILVACGVKDPTSLARMEPAELWARVKPFIKTAEGRRIVRNGKTPELGEIEDWISWAQKSRTMKAA